MSLDFCYTLISTSSMEAWDTKAQSIIPDSRHLCVLESSRPMSKRDLADLGPMRASVPPEKEGELKGLAESG